MPMQVTSPRQESAAKKQRIDEKVFHKGFDGKTAEYCPYDVTSKVYDTTRSPLGMNVALGTMCLNDTPITEQHLLDIGCGTGTFLEKVKGKMGKVQGLEYNDGMISQAKARLGADFPIVQGSADKMPFEDASFHACTINQVVHHFPKDDDYAFCKKAFAEVFRVLKPGGWLILCTSTPEQQRDAFWWLSLFPTGSDAICSRFPPLETIKKAVQDIGFEFNADSVAVPTKRTLMSEHKYLEHGVKAAFMATYRMGDSSWTMVENMGELESGLKTLQEKIDNGTSDAWLAQREALRVQMGQATFVSVRKPL